MPDAVHHVMWYTVYDTKKVEPARAPTRTSPRDDEFRRPSPHVKQEPPALVSQQQFPVASDAIVIADELAKRKPERLYRVFDADMNVVYAR